MSLAIILISEGKNTVSNKLYGNYVMKIFRLKTTTILQRAQENLNSLKFVEMSNVNNLNANVTGKRRSNQF